MGAAAAGARPRLNTIHQVKGDQAEAVLVLMPASAVTDRTLTAWLAGTASEPGVVEALSKVAGRGYAGRQ